jgi:hypothetical protein
MSLFGRKKETRAIARKCLPNFWFSTRKSRANNIKMIAKHNYVDLVHPTGTRAAPSHREGQPDPGAVTRHIPDNYEAKLKLHNSLPGRGVELAEGASVTKDDPLAIYAGRVVLEVPSSDYVLALPSFRRKGVTWDASVDAGHLRTAVAPPSSTRPCWSTLVTTRRCA